MRTLVPAPRGSICIICGDPAGYVDFCGRPCADFADECDRLRETEGDEAAHDYVQRMHPNNRRVA